ncbi:hypothetical protein ILUMI_18804 [Ignelater luminosus]|uniref:Uncharacterized protein n=1 Tax=Ignelater luminosus TaxID=2038154 RepID=A0A8K0G620_IGNLU|nr:hypothetical protein ILUMI_18804 [Ignelater luminosus]
METEMKTFKILRSSLHFRMGNNFKKITKGPPSVLTADEENTLVRWITTRNAINFTKCLGKRPATPTLTFEQFSDFCGVDMLNQLRQQPSEQDSSSHEAVLRRPDRGTELEDQLPTLEESNSSNEFLSINKNNDCVVLERDEELTAILSRCTNQTEIKVAEDNIQEENISPDDILENKIQNHENLHRFTPKTPPIKSSTENSSPLEDVLFWPKTPERKGKRNSKRMPFEAVNAAFLDILEATRTVYTNGTRNHQQRRKKLNVPAGKSVAHKEISPEAAQTSKPSRQQGRCDEKESRETRDEDNDLILQDSSDDDFDTFKMKILKNWEKDNKNWNRRVNRIRMSSLGNPGSGRQERMNYFMNGRMCLGSINPPKAINKRGLFRVPELENLV